ncbi:hypothetical protein ABK040_007972 [Willaertia magna]
MSEQDQQKNKQLEKYLILNFYSQYNSLAHFLYETKERRYATCRESLEKLNHFAEMSNYEVTPTAIRKSLYLYYSCLLGHLLDPYKTSKLVTCIKKLENSNQIFQCKDEILKDKNFVEFKVLDQIWQIEDRKYNLSEKINKCNEKCGELFYKFSLASKFLKARRIKRESDVDFESLQKEEQEKHIKYMKINDGLKKEAVDCVGKVFCENDINELMECKKSSKFPSDCDDLERKLKRCSHYHYALMAHLKFKKVENTLNNITSTTSGTGSNEDNIPLSEE